MCILWLLLAFCGDNPLCAFCGDNPWCFVEIILLVGWFIDWLSLVPGRWLDFQLANSRLLDK